MISGRGGGGTSMRAGRIRPPRRPGRLTSGIDTSDFEQCWETLKQALTDIHNQNCSTLSFEQLYRASYKIVLKKKGEMLYDRVKQHEEQYFSEHVIPEIDRLVTANLVSAAMGGSATSVNERRKMGEHFLKGVRASWDHHNTSMNMTADILMYLDRGYTQDARRASIYTATIGLFRDHILRACLNSSGEYTVFDILNSVILDHINMERDGDNIDRHLLRNIVRMLDCLYESDEENESEKLYLTTFEPAYLQSEREYYKQECERLLRDADAGAWLRHTQRRLAEENDRCDTTIHYETREKSIKVVEEELISAHLDDFLNLEGSGLKSMVNYDREEELSILFKLVSRVDPKKTSLKSILSARVVELGLEIEQILKDTNFATAATADGEEGEGAEKAKTLSSSAQQTAAAIKWVDDVLKLKDKFDNLWKKCFQEDLIIQTALTKSFSDFINMFTKSSEYVSLFIDDNLRRGIRGKTETETEEVLEKAITVIRYLSDKDLFERYYQKHLAKRLLHNKSESHDVEKSMISRMKQELGNQFTAKFEGMFRDMESSAELSSGYRDHIRGLGDVERKQIDLAVNILTTNSWPPDIMGRNSQFADGAGCNWPDEIKRLQDSLLKFYLTNRSGRKLTWLGSTGSADIKMVFPAIPGGKGPLSRERRYELNVPTYGMVILMLFNELEEDQELSLEEIQAKTNIPTPDLTRVLASISIVPKARVLLKEPATKSVKAGDKFRFNSAFVSKQVRIKAPIINATSKVEGDEERKQTEEKNNQTRAHVIDAALVRIMKQRKELTHTHLLSEVIEQLKSRFTPEVTLIKKRIEDLIVREYLERVEDVSTPTYRYLA
ncbi:Cullin-3 [Colletotrichum fructicola]|uniref:Cullin-3 n=1 Tax=Colletotrichum fructicola (strain Nara gc5) TaxID=1213859 RepID=L2GC00_COLFN|nr:Cullin-3 [Colletotrichum fructicola]KAF4491565.1 Cullin-3 [Colletotrichum fructicola Nara gc5]KAE9578993.1 Cullin-3 [Colletotrichum fructicola]KAF4432736.1 Cullin-3 [Colletotrichum fructicola]KAF4904830.1 Cullin-3 [Colletotrichum fructicola]KAF4915415.1 Cullin-3 [Colletotrichum fructicola]